MDTEAGVIKRKRSAMVVSSCR